MSKILANIARVKDKDVTYTRKTYKGLAFC